MIFGLWKRSETDSTKIVSYTASAAGVCVARVAYEDIRQAFGLPGVSNELLRARANARVTNKKALSEIATSLLEAGQAKRIYDYLVVDIAAVTWLRERRSSRGVRTTFLRVWGWKQSHPRYLSANSNWKVT